MKTRSNYPLIGVILLVTFSSCQKVDSNAQWIVARSIRDSASMQVNPQDTTQPPNTVNLTPPPPYPQSAVTGCSYAPSYGDSIIFPQPTAGGDYIVSPVNNPGAGKYYAWPMGIVIDSITGAIDLTKSETGMKYAIGFVKNGTHDTCLNSLVIGGANYIDSLYVINAGQTTAYPYFNANPYLPVACAGGGCSFDITGSAANKKIVVDPNTGAINLAKTLTGNGLLGGAFGLQPNDGVAITAPIYYRLNDASNNAIQSITVQVMYYTKTSKIPANVMNMVTTRQNNLFYGNLLSNYANPRPPLIIIVRNF